MNYGELIFFDLETSGLFPEEHDIIQIAAIDAVTGDEFERYVRFKLGKFHNALEDVRMNIRVASQLVSMITKEIPAWAKRVQQEMADEIF